MNFLLVLNGLILGGDLVLLYLQSNGIPTQRISSEVRMQPENPPCTEEPQTNTDQTHLQQLISYHLETEDRKGMEKKCIELNFGNIKYE